MLDRSAFDPETTSAPAGVVDLSAFDPAPDTNYKARVERAIRAYSDRVTGVEERKQERLASGSKHPGIYTTKYAIAHGRSLGWKLIDRENYNYRTKRHHDLQLGLDVLFDDGVHGMVGVQAAGKGERAEHYQRFLDRGGPEKARRRHIRVLYWEFIRGEQQPIKEEVWSDNRAP